MGLQFLKLKENKPLYAIECLKMKPVENDPGLVTKVVGENSEGILPREGPTGWHTCGICLEDIFDDDLMIHGICGGVLCSDCLEATACYHSGKSFPCPVGNLMRNRCALDICKAVVRVLFNPVCGEPHAKFL